MTPTNSARDEVRPSRLSLLIGSAVALLCLGAGVASAQTTESDPAQEPAATSEPAAPDATEATEEEAAEPQGADDEDGAASDDENEGETASDDASGEDEAARGERIPRLLLENVTPHQIYFAGKKPAEFHFKHTGAGTTDLRIEVVKKGKGDVIQRWRRNNVDSDKKEQVRWDGSKSGGGHVRKGRFFFRVETIGGDALKRQRASGRREFLVAPAIFPVRGKHQYWDGWGAGRGHQGQDIGAKCGRKLVAAEAGKVVAKSYDGGGYGYYVIVNVRSANRAEVYSHMKRPARVRKGKRVKTGEKLGNVGATGNATGCHLHFEYWKGDYPRGHATPKATKRLRAWDKWS